MPKILTHICKKTILLFMIIFIDDYSSLVLFIEQKIENKLKLAEVGQFFSKYTTIIILSVTFDNLVQIPVGTTPKTPTFHCWPS